MRAQTKDRSQAGLDRVWEIIEKIGVCMLTTQFPGGLRARPLEARPDRNAGVIWFVTDKRSSKEHEIEAEHDVGLVFIDTKEKAYLSLTARAQVRPDHAKAAEIWKSTDSVWWNGPDDPNVCVLLVRPVTAELWDGPASAAVAAFEFAKARLTGEKPNLGENRKVALRMYYLSSLSFLRRGARGPDAAHSTRHRRADDRSTAYSKSCDGMPGSRTQIAQVDVTAGILQQWCAANPRACPYSSSSASALTACSAISVSASSVAFSSSSVSSKSSAASVMPSFSAQALSVP